MNEKTNILPIEKATLGQSAAIIAFYEDMVENSPGMANYAGWRKGLHPSSDLLLSHIRDGNMYLYREDDTIVAAMVLCICQATSITPSVGECKPLTIR